MTAEEKMSRALGIMLASIAVFVAAMIVLIVLLVSTAFAQHVHPDETITDERVAKFYETWKRPPARAISCCSSKDCYAAPIRRGAGGGLEYFHKWSQAWAAIPQNVLESNQPDPLDSPNHEAHICAATACRKSSFHVLRFQLQFDAQPQQLGDRLGHRIFAQRVALRRSPADSEPIPR